MKNAFFRIAAALIVNLLLFSACQEQHKDSILNEKMEKLDMQTVQMLTDKGFLAQADVPMFRMYLLRMSPDELNRTAMTYGQMLDSFDKFKRAELMAAPNRTTTGNDSVFIRTPRNERAFLGMGEMRLEEIIARESGNLPEKYKGDYNLLMDGSATSSTAMARLSENNDDIAWAVGNVVLAKRDSGELSSLRIGDIFEIAKRVAHSKEMAPFIEQLK